MQPRIYVYVLPLWYKPHRPPPPPKKKTKQNKTKQNKKKSEKTAFNGVVYMSAKENLTSEQESIIVIAGLAVKLF